jgi:transcriptional regulator with XRE-family HTH domain
LSQEELGRRLGTGRKLISAWERGTQLPTVRNLFRLARALGTLGEALYQDLFDVDHKTFEQR